MYLAGHQSVIGRPEMTCGSGEFREVSIFGLAVKLIRIKFNHPNSNFYLFNLHKKRIKIILIFIAN
jgi:hypothetical protein